MISFKLTEEQEVARDALREYADQLTYSGRAATAVGVYRELIAAELMVRPDPSAGPPGRFTNSPLSAAVRRWP